MTQQNAAMVEETTAAARSLASEAQSLMQLVSRFQVEKVAGPQIATGKVVKLAPAKRHGGGSGPTALALWEDEEGWDGL